MGNEFGLAFSNVTELAAIASYKWLGKGDKNQADASAVDAMRKALNKMNIRGTIVIGEGEIDEAPMLYIGENVGSGSYEVDIAVDPIEGTRMTALGQSNAISVLAASEAGGLLKAPDMYMEKIIVSSKAKGVIDLDLSLEENLELIASRLNKKVENLVVATLDKPRHQSMIKNIQKLGVKVYAFPDGDVAASVLACLSNNDVDLVYCIGGAPEGIISAAMVKALNGDMNARLLSRATVKGDIGDNLEVSKLEESRCNEMGVSIGEKLTLSDMIKTDRLIFVATGITKGDIVDGVEFTDNFFTTHTLLIDGISGSIRNIYTKHLNK